MDTNVQALKNLYEQLGGDPADVANVSTNVEVLNAIAAKFDGESDATINPDAIANIAAVVGDILEYSAVVAGLIDRSIETITIPDSVTTIGDAAFNGCTALASVEIPDSVTTIDESAFGGCTALASVEIPDSVTTISNATFSGCTALKDFIIPNGVQSIGMVAFASCSSLVSIEIPASVTEIGTNCFINTTALTTITIHKPENSISGAPWGAPNATVIWAG